MIESIAKFLNMSAQIPFYADKENELLPSLDKRTVMDFVTKLAILISEEEVPTAQRDMTPIATIQARVGEDQVCRKIFIQYCTARLAARDINTLSILLPIVVDTLPENDDKNNLARAAHISAYESLGKTVLNLIAKNYMVECATSLAWRTTLMDRFLFRLAKWSYKMHRELARLLVNFYADEKVLRALGQHVAVVADWAEFLYSVGVKTDDVRAALSPSEKGRCDNAN